MSMFLPAVVCSTMFDSSLSLSYSDVKLAAQIVSSDVKCGEGDCNFLDNSGVFNIVIAFYHSINLVSPAHTCQVVAIIVMLYPMPLKPN